MEEVSVSEWMPFEVAVGRMRRVGRVVVRGDAVSTEAHMRMIYAKHGWALGEFEELAVEWRAVSGRSVSQGRGRKS